ncbi:MAG: tetratricopeptide repeat protein [Opitutales bacterium]|nr:tetratricopeptide repeat protein [Opitutales bacterium]
MQLDELFRDAVRKQQSGDVAGARALFVRVLDALPNHPEVLFRLGILEHGAGDFDKAVSYLSRASIGKPDNANYALMHATALVSAKRNDEAAAIFERYADGADKGAAYASFNLATLFLERGDSQQALELLDASLARFPGDEALQKLRSSMGE